MECKEGRQGLASQTAMLERGRRTRVRSDGKDRTEKRKNRALRVKI